MSRRIDWEDINNRWGEIMKLARADPKMQQEVDFDAEGRILTSNRPAIESLICARTEKRAKILYFLQMLGLYQNVGRIIELGVKTRMPVGSGGKGKVTNRGKR